MAWQPDEASGQSIEGDLPSIWSMAYMLGLPAAKTCSSLGSSTVHELKMRSQLNKYQFLHTVSNTVSVAMPRG